MLCGPAWPSALPTLPAAGPRDCRGVQGGRTTVTWAWVPERACRLPSDQNITVRLRSVRADQSLGTAWGEPIFSQIFLAHPGVALEGPSPQFGVQNLCSTEKRVSLEK